MCTTKKTTGAQGDLCMHVEYKYVHAGMGKSVPGNFFIKMVYVKN